RVHGNEHTAAETLGSMRLSQAGTRLAFLSDADEGTLDVIDLTTGARLRRIDTKARDVKRIDWVDHDRSLAIWSDAGLAVFDAAGGARVRGCTACRLGRGVDLELSPNGARVA